MFRYPQTEEMFFVQNAGAKDAGTGLKKSNIIQKISLEAAQALVDGKNETAEVEVITVNTDPPVINSNGNARWIYVLNHVYMLITLAGATNFRGQLVFTGEGQGDKVAPALYLMNPRKPYNTTGTLCKRCSDRRSTECLLVIVNNFSGRQFNSLNDVAINPRNGEIYFTDSLYGYLQDFRPPPGIPTQVYRLNTKTGALTTVADGFDKPNGKPRSSDHSPSQQTHISIQESHSLPMARSPTSPTRARRTPSTASTSPRHPQCTLSPSPTLLLSLHTTIPLTPTPDSYRYKVEDDGTFSSRKTFAYASPGIPDGIHCDTNGNVYSGVGDGVQVWSPSGTLLGKIYLGRFAANFRFAGKGRMVIAAQTELYYATLAAEGGDPKSQF
jgi:gluconolactonase